MEDMEKTEKTEKASKASMDLETKKTLKTLQTLEKRIMDTQASFLIAGEALNEINLSEAYKTRGYKKWSDYVNDVFDMSCRHSYKLINAFGVYRALEGLGFVNLPKTESQCRPMTRLLSLINDQMLLPKDEQIIVNNIFRDTWNTVLAHKPVLGSNKEGKRNKITAAKVTSAVTIALGAYKKTGDDDQKEHKAAPKQASESLEALAALGATGLEDFGDFEDGVDGEHFMDDLDDLALMKNLEIQQLREELNLAEERIKDLEATIKTLEACK